MLPEKFLNRMEALLKDEYPAFLHAIEQNSVRAMRLNSLKSEAFVLENAFFPALAPIPYASDGYIFDIDKIGNHPLHHAGAFYVQDPGAMATLHALPIKKGWHVADFCAAPGGKASQLSAYVGEEGLVLANEIDHGRCKALAGNFERLGVRNVLLTNTDSASISSWYPCFFDLVLVDAPCSGEGMFRKYDHARSEWSEENVLSCAKLQREILDHAAAAVKNGGYLLYSTCTFSLEENEKNVDSFLFRHPDFCVQSISDALIPYTAEGIAFEGALHPDALRLTRRFYPHIAMGEGQYIALFKKRGEAEESTVRLRDVPVSLSKDEQRTVTAFFDSVLDKEGQGIIQKAFQLVRFKESVFLKNAIPMPPRSVYMPGVCVGTLVKGRIEPHHQFFSAFGKYFQRKEHFSKDTPLLQRYLRGETFPSMLANGYAAVLVEGCALGGIKVSSGVAKNHYPKGLRLH